MSTVIANFKILNVKVKEKIWEKKQISSETCVVFGCGKKVLH